MSVGCGVRVKADLDCLEALPWNFAEILDGDTLITELLPPVPNARQSYAIDSLLRSLLGLDGPFGYNESVYVGPVLAKESVNRELATLRRMLRLAHEWREIERVPRIRLLSGERIRDFVLSRKQEEIYLAACPEPLNDIAVLILETGLRIGEALRLEWGDITLAPVNGARFGFLRVREGKSKNACRVIPLTDRAAAVLRKRAKYSCSQFVFANREGKTCLGTSINHLHRNACAPKVEGVRRPIFPADFVLHSLRHTMLTRLGESGVDAFTIMRIAGHSSIVVSQRYIHPTPEAVERAFERLQLSGASLSKKPKRLPPATISATPTRKAAVSH